MEPTATLHFADANAELVLELASYFSRTNHVSFEAVELAAIQVLYNLAQMPPEAQEERSEGVRAHILKALTNTFLDQGDGKD